MMELTLFMQICMVFFFIVGFLHGIYREFVAMLGIITGLFILTEFNWVLDFLLPRTGPGVRFILQMVILMAITFFAYQQAPDTFVPGRYRGRRGNAFPEFEGMLMKFAAGALGAFDGYLVIGSLWYYMDQYQYPLHPLVMMPAVNSGSAEFVNKLPPVWLHGEIIMIVMAVILAVIFIFK